MLCMNSEIPTAADTTDKDSKPTLHAQTKPQQHYRIPVVPLNRNAATHPLTRVGNWRLRLEAAVSALVHWHLMLVADGRGKHLLAMVMGRSR